MLFMYNTNILLINNHNKQTFTELFFRYLINPKRGVL